MVFVPHCWPDLVFGLASMEGCGSALLLSGHGLLLTGILAFGSQSQEDAPSMQRASLTTLPVCRHHFIHCLHSLAHGTNPPFVLLEPQLGRLCLSFLPRCPQYRVQLLHTVGAQ